METTLHICRFLVEMRRRSKVVGKHSGGRRGCLHNSQVLSVFIVRLFVFEKLPRSALILSLTHPLSSSQVFSLTSLPTLLPPVRMSCPNTSSSHLWPGEESTEMMANSGRTWPLFLPPPPPPAHPNYPLSPCPTHKAVWTGEEDAGSRV